MISEVNAYQLRKLREQAGFTQVQLAERTEVSQRQVSRMEKVISIMRRSALFKAVLRQSAAGWLSHMLRAIRIQVA
ncbi:helix-turn-helix transcriptional regulator [uncultured Corynebacterium sp.]|uniref:helix-turn-helix domain-containing protein n=1 Tax=uncultured Corynebacterium sp. TaxID=159447 RepID=UPI0025DDDC89|nr:helix-turn-helix transcriptional regulator [uncultured Corynebacterium sp.]